MRRLSIVCVILSVFISNITISAGGTAHAEDGSGDIKLSGTKESLGEINRVITDICRASDTYLDGFYNTTKSWERRRLKTDDLLFKARDVLNESHNRLKEIACAHEGIMGLRSEMLPVIGGMRSDTEATLKALEAFDQKDPDWANVNQAVTDFTNRMRGIWSLTNRFVEIAEKEFPELKKDMLPIVLFQPRKKEFKNTPIAGFDPYISKEALTVYVVNRAPSPGGLRRGDVILGVKDGDRYVELRDMIEYSEFLKNKKISDRITFIVERNGKREEKNIWLYRR